MKDPSLEDQYIRGRKYEKGVGGLPQDFKKAIKCFRYAADEQNHPGAQLTLGMLLLHKFIITKDDANYQEGKKWLYRAEDQEFPEAVRLQIRYRFERDPLMPKSRLSRLLREYYGICGMSLEDWQEFFKQMT